MTGHRTVPTPGRHLATLGALELVLPECEKGLGKLIGAADSADLIDGIRIAPLSLFPDDCGYFMEVQRFGHGLAAHFPAATSQVSVALNYPGTIKAFHYYLHQTDCWTPGKGLFQVVLVDLRIGSPTFGLRNTLYVGQLRPWQILIPPGIGHGYKVVYRRIASTTPRTRGVSPTITRRSIMTGSASTSSAEIR